MHGRPQLVDSQLIGAGYVATSAPRPQFVLPSCQPDADHHCYAGYAITNSQACHVVPGNFFFAGARIFFQSLEAAVFLFSRVARIPEGSIVLPAICTEERITLGAELVCSQR